MNSFKSIKLFALLANMLFVLSGLASTYHVSNTGDDLKNGLSLANAFKTIQKATDIVVAGDSIWVYDGFYKGFNHKNKNSGNSKNPIVYLAKGNNVVINEGSNIGDGINIEENDWIEIIGFKVLKVPNNPNIAGGEEGIRAVYADHITIRNCTVDSCFRGIFTGYTDYITIEHNVCTRSYGEHGIYVSNNSDNIILRFNSSSYNKATGIQINPDLSSGAPGYSVRVVCTNNIIFENKGAAGFNFQGIDSALIANNLIYNNHNASGIVLFHGNASKGCTHVKVYNNTILVPPDGRWGIHIIDDASYIRIHNNIIINQHTWKGAIALQAGSYTQSNIMSNFNLVTNRFCETDDGCTKTLAQWQIFGYDLNSILAPVSLNSLFEDYSNNNFHLKAGSLAINAGTSFVASDVTSDYDLNSRPSGTGYDIGCFEFITAGIESDNFANKKNIFIENNKIHFRNLKPDEFAIVYDLFGKMIGQGSNIDSESLPSGIYFYQIVSGTSTDFRESGKFFFGN